VNDEDDILPPSRGLLVPTVQKPPAVGNARGVDTGGAVRSGVTGWQARVQGWAIARITDRTRNETALLRAQSELAAAYEATALKVNRLRHLPEIIELDDAKFRAELEAEYEGIEQLATEREHQFAIAEQRRCRELADAQGLAEEARRKKFTTAQGFENQRRLKGRNFRTWETRAEALRLDAEAKAAKLRRDAHNGADAATAVGKIRANAQQALSEALANGDDAQAQCWRRVLDMLD
jgi:hypothetical protein